MRRPFRDHHLLLLLEEYDLQAAPLDFAIFRYFKSHKSLGSKDRAYIAETVYGMVRWKGLLDYLIGKPPSWEKRLELYKHFDSKLYQQDDSIPLFIRVSFPEELFSLFVNNYGESKAKKICLDCNTQAPPTIRVNILKISREELLKTWEKEGYEVFPCKKTEEGIVFKHRIPLFSLPEFKKGFFEVQDEGSQCIAKLVQTSPGEQVMDFCAGSGGKTLAFAPLMQNKGQIYLHDIRKSALLEAKQRLKRAGIQNAQILSAEDPKLKSLKKKMDWVLVDAPCTGTGTLRRNPDMKWRFTKEMLQRLLSQQRVVFEKGLSFLKPEGKIVYATCSILQEENELQLAHFLKTYDLLVEGPPFSSLPTPGGMDGFYGAILIKK